MDELTALVDLARATAVEAGELLLRRRGEASHGASPARRSAQELGVATKSPPPDLVTEVDRAAERLVVGRLLDARPADGLIGEEGATVIGSSGVSWLVDPIDGTTNFVYGLPAYAVSIAAEVDGQAVAGVVLNAATGELWSATAGGGAHLAVPGADPVRLTGSRPASLDRALVATGFGYRAEQRRAQAAVVAELLPQVRDIRRHGSAALELCTVAAGRVDAYYEMHLNRWDFAAGALVAAEAGVVVTGLAGRPFAEPLGIAVAPSVAEEFVALLERLHAA